MFKLKNMDGVSLQVQESGARSQESGVQAELARESRDQQPTTNNQQLCAKRAFVPFRTRICGTVFALLLISLLACSASAGEIYRIRVVNQKGGPVEVSSDGGEKWVRAGSVIHPATTNNRNSFSAGRWAAGGCVAGVATHSIHIKVGHLPATAGGMERAMLISLVPGEFRDMSTGVMVRRASSSCIVTDIAAGSSIFRSFAPFVGNRVFLEVGGAPAPIPDNYLPVSGDVLLMIVEAPARYPREIVFENKAGGAITSVYDDGSSEEVARVVRPVSGIGRFEGTSWAGPGRVTSNHPGVITVSTAPFSRQTLLADELSDFAVESRGGFQIVPWDHARDSRLDGSQWMTVAPLNEDDPPIGGRYPLFSYFISLSYEPQNPELSSEVQVRLDGGPWEGVPQIIGRVDNAFEPSCLNAYYASRGRPRHISSGVTHIRILLPHLGTSL
ncbi:MAG: hypothetical protein PHT33_03975 [bacterium]|nr:hypothetical protein [bacterium]